MIQNSKNFNEELQTDKDTDTHANAEVTALPKLPLGELKPGVTCMKIHTRDVRNELLISIWRLQISS